MFLRRITDQNKDRAGPTEPTLIWSEGLKRHRILKRPHEKMKSLKSRKVKMGLVKSQSKS